MKFLATSLLASLAIAAPLAVPQASSDAEMETLAARQLRTSKNELEQGSSSSCPKVIFVFARGTTEQGNLGSLGIPLGNALETKYGASQVWVQGVGGPYVATVPGNLMSRGSTPEAIAEMVRLLNLANSKCPNAKVVAGGYSQGAALAAAAISDLKSTVSAQVVGAVLFGYTKNLQNNGKIPNYPADNTKIFCATGDLVCSGSLIITAAHLSYGPEASSAAPQFLESKIDG
ncbi:hypothetical protein ACEQ8H_002284 [Pleosporales sp. CAS-2024a]